MSVVEYIETNTFPGEVRYRYQSELDQGNRSYIKGVDENVSAYPIITVRNLQKGQCFVFELVSLTYSSVKDYDFGFYMKESGKGGLHLENGLLIYSSNGRFSQDIIFEDVGILRGKHDPRKMSKKEWRDLNLKKLRISYCFSGVKSYSNIIAYDRSSTKKTLTILDYAPTHIVRDYHRNESHMIIILRENVKQENIHVLFEDKVSHKKYSVLPTDLEVVKQSVIKLKIPPPSFFESEKVEFIVVYTRDSNHMSRSEWKVFNYVQSRIDKRKREKNEANFEENQKPKKSTLDNVRQVILSRNQSLNPSSNISVVSTPAPANVPDPSSVVYPVLSTSSVSAFFVFPSNVSVAPQQPVLYQASSISPEPLSMTPSSPESTSMVVNPVKENSATLHEVPMTLPTLDDIEDFLYHMDSSQKTTDYMLYETDKVGEMLSVTSLDDDVYFDGPKRQRETNKDTKQDTSKRLKSNNEVVQPPTVNHTNEMANRCIQQIFRIPHLLSFGFLPPQILIDTCKKIPEILTGEDGWGDSPLNNALLKDKNEAARFLIDMLIECNATAHLNDTNDDGHSPLILLANSTCDEELVVKLLQYGADITAVDTMQRSVFHYAVCNKKEKMLGYLLNHALHIGQLNLLLQEDVYRLTSFHLATFCEESPGILQILLQYILHNGDNPNHVSSQNGRSALHMAIAHNLHVSLERLLRCEAVDVNFPMLDGRRPFQLAIAMQYPERLLEIFRLRCAEISDYISDSEDEEACPVSSTCYTTDAALEQCETLDNTLSHHVFSSVSHSVEISPIDVADTQFKSDDEVKTLLSGYDKASLFEFANGLLEFAQLKGRDGKCQSKLNSLHGTMKKNGENLKVVNNLVLSMWKVTMRP